MIIYLYGADTHRSEQSLEQMRTKFIKDRDPQGLNVQVVAVADLPPEAVIEHLFTAPFLAEKRLVIIPNLIERGSKELHALLLGVIKEERLPADTIVIVTDGEIKPRAKASKELQTVLQSQPYSRAHEALQGYEKKQWIARVVQERGGSIAESAVTRLSEQEMEMIQIEHLLAQLVAYRDGEMIRDEDVALFLPPGVDDNIFHLVEAAIAGNRKLVFDQMREQYRQGKDGMYVFSMLLRQYRIMLDIADALEKGVNLRASGAAKDLGLHPFVLKKTLPLVNRLSKETLEQAYLSLLSIDQKVKTGGGTAEELVDFFIGGVRA